jgi:hypothetical protein
MSVMPFLAILLACGGGGGGGGGNGGGNAATTIEGRVENVSTAQSGGGAGTGSVGGIRVEAVEAGETLDVTTTDIEGRFTLEFVSDGTVDLLFVTDTTTLRLSLDVVPGTVVTLVVELHIDEDEVVVVDDDFTDGRPIRCETGNVSISDDALDLVIDGEGDDCIRTAGNCVMDIRVHSLTLVGCERCIDAEGGSDIQIVIIPGSFACQSSDDGIRAGGNAGVLIDALAGVDIDSSDGGGIRADGTAQVVLGSDGVCHVEGENALRANGASSIDLDACLAVDLDDDGGFPGDNPFDDDD